MPACIEGDRAGAACGRKGLGDREMLGIRLVHDRQRTLAVGAERILAVCVELRAVDTRRRWAASQSTRPVSKSRIDIFLFAQAEKLLRCAESRARPVGPSQPGSGQRPATFCRLGIQRHELVGVLDD